METMLPHNIQAEMCVLGSVLIDENVMNEIIHLLKPDDFYREGHRLIYQAMVSLYELHTSVNTITLTDLLDVRGKIEECGGLGYIVGLVNEPPTSFQAVHFATIVAEKAYSRRAAKVLQQLATIVYSEETSDRKQAQMEELVYALKTLHSSQNFQHISELASEYMQELDSLHEKKQTITGTTTGLADLDRMTGGLQRTDLAILAGRPAMGKTSLGLSLAINAARAGLKVAIFSLEMSKMQLMRRITAMLAVSSKIDMVRLRTGDLETDEQWEDVIETMEKIAGYNLWINDASGTPTTKIRADMRRLTQDYGQFDLIMVDYIQIMDGPESKKRELNRVQEISHIARELKAIAKEFNLPVLALAQISREAERSSNKIPQLSHLKESGAIEENADLVMMIHRPAYYATAEELENNPSMKNIAELIIAKHRNGDTGTLQLFYYGPKTIFGNLERALG